MANLKAVDANKLDSLFTGIADAIRTKEGSSDLIPNTDMAQRILDLKGGSGGDYDITAEVNDDGTQTLHIVDADGKEDDMWYPADTALLFKHFKNGVPDINKVGFSDVFTNVSDKYGGSIIPFECGQSILLRDFIGAEGTIVFDYSQKGRSNNYQRLLSLEWSLNGSMNQRYNIYAEPNSDYCKIETVSQSGSYTPSQSTCIVTFDATSEQIYIPNATYGSYEIMTYDTSRDKGSSCGCATIGSHGTNSSLYLFNGYIWNVAYIPRVINDAEIQKIFGK